MWTLFVLGEFVIYIILFEQGTEYKMSSTSCAFVSELGCCSDDVIVSLKENDEINIQTIIPESNLLYDGDVWQAVNILHSSDDHNISQDPDEQKQSMLDGCEWDMQVIKNSYNTYIHIYYILVDKEIYLLHCTNL